MSTAKKSVLWLASYPKSGNTWVRLFLLNYLMNRPEPIPINQAHRLGASDASFALYQRISGDRTLRPDDTEKILRLRPAMIENHAANGADVNFMKTHCHNGRWGAMPLIPPQCTRGAIYVIRNPLDIVPSYADHYGVSLERAIEQIGNPDNAALAGRSVTSQFLGDWTKHVRSWTREKRFPVCTVRYEDLHADPADTFGRVLDFVGAPGDDARRDRAIAAASFGELRKQEDTTGFIEKGDRGTRFFRQGRAGGWRDVLSPDLVQAVCDRHGPMMEKFGYLP